MATVSYFQFFDRGGEACIGFPLGSPRKLSRTVAETIRSKPCYMVGADGSASPVLIQGVTAMENDLVAWFPTQKAWTANQAQDKKDRLALFNQTSKAILAVSRLDPTMAEGQFSPLAYLQAGTDTLVLNPALTDLIAGNLGPEEHAIHVEPYRHASQNQKDRFKFGMAAWMYQSICNELPFSEHEGIPLDWAKNQGLVTPLALRGIAVPGPVEDFLERVLHNHQFPGTMKTYADLGELIIQEQAVQAAEATAIAKAQRRMDRARKASKRSVWFKRHGTKLLVATVAFILIGTIPATMISKALEPPKTLGMGPEQVIRQFYQAASDFDLEFMEDAVMDRDKNSLLAESQNAMLISKVRMASERREVVLKVPDWRVAGSPALPADMGIFGIDGIEIQRLVKINDQEYHADIAYSWFDTFMNGPEEGQSEYVPTAEKRLDSMILVFREKTWIIASYQRSISPQE